MIFENLDGLKIIYGDCIEVLKDPQFNSSIDLIYADPPFQKNTNYSLLKDDIYGRREYDDIWKGGSVSNVTNYFKSFLSLCKANLKETGAIIIHLNEVLVHYIKVEMDKEFGINNFLNHIIWCYSGGGAGKNRFANKHDDILIYAKNKNQFQFNPQYLPYKNPNGKHMNGTPLRKEGKLMEDWWTDIKPVHFQAKNKRHPTQKPIKLIERLINACSKEEDIVLDPYMGSGSTLEAARNGNRKGIGIEYQLNLCEIASKALHLSKYQIENYPLSIQDCKKLNEENPFEFHKLVLRKIKSKPMKQSQDRGIDGILEPFDALKHNGLTSKRAGVQVKFSNANPSTVRDFASALTHKKLTQGILICGGSTSTQVREAINKAYETQSLKIIYEDWKRILPERKPKEGEEFIKRKKSEDKIIKSMEYTENKFTSLDCFTNGSKNQ